MPSRLTIDPEDYREPGPTGRRRRPLGAILLAVAIGALAGGSWWVYRLDAPRPPPATVPEIRPDERPIKETPANPGGMVVRDQDSLLLNREGAREPKIEQLLPPPETPLPRPAPPQPPPQVAEAPAPSLAPPAVAAPPPPAPVAPAAAGSVAAAPVAPVPSTQVAATAAPALASPPDGKAYRLQLGAVRSPEAAQQEWQRLKRLQPDLLGKLEMTTAQVTLADKGVFYRILAGPILDAEEAERSCGELRRRNLGCILVKP